MLSLCSFIRRTDYLYTYLYKLTNKKSPTRTHTYQATLKQRYKKNVRVVAEKNKNILERIKKVQELVYGHYEPENQAKSKLQIYRRIVRKVYPMSERTFWRYMNTKIEKKEI